MPFSYDRAWQDLMAMLRANWTMLLAIAGLFVFLPAFALFTFAPMPEPDPETANILDVLVAYYRGNLHWFVLANVAAAYGQIAMLVLLVDRSRPTVGEALGIAGRLFPAYFVAQILTNLAVGAGAMLFIVPGLYVLGRFSVVGPLIADRRVGNPINAIRDGWALTDKRGWRIVGLILLVAIVAWIAFSAATSVLTVLGSLAAPESARPMVAGFANALNSTALGLLVTLLTAAIYRQIAGDSRVADVFS